LLFACPDPHTLQVAEARMAEVEEPQNEACPAELPPVIGADKMKGLFKKCKTQHCVLSI